MLRCALFSVALCLIVMIAGFAQAQVWTLRLDRALPSDTALLIKLQADESAGLTATAFAPDFNIMPFTVDATKLTVTADAVRGTLALTIHADNWQPKGDTDWQATLTLDVTSRDGSATGSYQGKVHETQIKGDVTGTHTDAAALPEPSRLSFLLERPFGKANRHWQNRARLSFNLVAGKPAAVRVQPLNNTTYADWTAHVTEASLTTADGQHVLAVTTDVTGSDRWPSEAVQWIVRWREIDSVCFGSYVTRKPSAPDQPLATEPCRGERQATTLPPATDAVHVLELHTATSNGQGMWVYLEAIGGDMGQGLAYTPRFNRSVHEVDASGLRLEGDRLRGRLLVTVLADPYHPKDGKPIACTYDIDAVLRHGGMAGSFTGRFGSDEVRGPIGGESLAREPRAGTMHVHLKFEQGVTGGPAWFNRSFIGVRLEDGRAVSGSISNNKGGFKGRFNSADLVVSDRTVTGHVTCTIDEGRVKLGTYTWKLDGKLVGAHLVGTAEVLLDGKPIKRESFNGVVSGRGEPAED